mmetsp:Transcript_38634/g.78800  ORF Transcript_38634/g.78800 Transcript_38634/m.78800 type:complete len:88 (-) Transcript_38634:41-304(-)
MLPHKLLSRRSNRCSRQYRFQSHRRLQVNWRSNLPDQEEYDVLAWKGREQQMFIVSLEEEWGLSEYGPVCGVPFLATIIVVSSTKTT